MLEQQFEGYIRLYNSYDVNKRVLVINNHQLILYFCNFISDNIVITRIINNIKAIITTDNTINSLNICTPYELKQELANESVTITTDINKLGDALYNGDLIIIIDQFSEAIIIEARDYPGREIGEPDSEKVVRGSRDGFTESIGTNIGLIRRRIKSNELNIEKYIIGEYSKTNVALIYFPNKVEAKVISKVQDDLKRINIKELTMSDKALEELLVGKNTIFPLVKYTERPDTFVAHLYQGMFGILVDTSPSAILAPVCVFDHFQHAEEFRQTRLAGSYLRIIRFIGIILTFLIIPLWFTISYYNPQIPFVNKLFDPSFNATETFIQLILIELGIELVRMASIHTPSALATSMGLIAGIIIGDMAVDVGLFTQPIVLLGAISAIGSYITPSYELSLANKMVKLLIILLIYLLKLPGLIIGLMGLLIYLASLRSFTRPYLSPLIPFSYTKLIKQLFRPSYTNNN